VRSQLPEPDMVMHAFDASTREAEAGGSEVPDWLHSKTVSKKKKKKEASFQRHSEEVPGQCRACQISLVILCHQLPAGLGKNH
jgi:hypothetical protein